MWSKIDELRVGEPSEGMLKVLRKFLNRMCSVNKRFRQGLVRWRRRNAIRRYEWTTDEDAVYNNKEGRITQHNIVLRERRRITFEPIGREEREIPKNAIPTDKIEEWTIRMVKKTKRDQVHQREIEIGEKNMEVEEKYWQLPQNIEVLSAEKLLGTIRKGDTLIIVSNQGLKNRSAFG